ncbi:M28 family peptidase [Aeromicrobium piscarium]|uniref:M28 family peptidase n=1 Tax=Aeromicrobium piscarium TaxID=2590901 RepID=A0A554SFQ5_9ACTN|nr:M28 family peptidase [Aeromicrobium piscarium]TSD65171.1 M28 family peptidase [Aeromicrobium piscarium]
MKRLLCAAAAAALAGGLVAAQPATAKPPKPDDRAAQAQKVVDGVTVNGILRHLRQFQVIANAHDGNRASGLPGHEASADYIETQLRRAGYQVERQTFTFPFFQELAPSVLRTDAGDIEHHTFTYSGGGDVTGAVVPTNDIVIPATPEPSSTSGCEASDFDAAPEDPAIALVQRGTCDFAVKVENAVAAGYDAVIVMNEGNPGRTDIATGTLGAPQDVPVVGISYDDGVALAEGAVTVTVTTEVESDPDRETFNLIAELPARHQHAKGPGKGKGPKKPPQVREDEAIVVGAHLDSVTEGPGINDNGSGSAGILEIALQLSRTGVADRLERPVRFAWWGAEELGLLGSEHYVASLSPDELGSIYANLNFDMIGSENYVRFLYDGDGSAGGPAGPPGSGEIRDIFAGFFERQGLAWEPTEFDGRSDYGPFIAAGIPAGGVFSGADGMKTEQEAQIYGGTAGEIYDSCYHQLCDDMTAINTNALHELGDAAAWGVAQLGLGQPLYPDMSRAPYSQQLTTPDFDYKGGLAVR